MSPGRRRLLLAAELLLLSALILTTRCANYQDVFVGDHIYFTDADCYARMIRVRLCAQRPGLILRHHSFENFPQGTTPHTTAPLDYAILLFSFVLRPVTSRPIDLAGALISPGFALVGGAFLCWWSAKMAFRFRWAMLILYALSPILVHGTALGRPDHQSLSLLLVIVAVCADWAGERSESIGWSVVSGLGWGIAIWVSAYEPLILFVLTTFTLILSNAVGRLSRNEAEEKAEQESSSLTSESLPSYDGIISRLRWLTILAILLVALLIERRIPSFSVFVRDPIFYNWSHTVGELASIPLMSPVWFKWAGWTILALPILAAFAVRTKQTGISLTTIALLVVTFGLTMWQARWGYFFVALFAITLPVWLAVIRSKFIVWAVFVISLWPVLRDWDQKIWPNEFIAAAQLEQRHEAMELRELSVNLISGDRQPFLAPWWLSPSIAYWSGQPGVAGSSHESLAGIADTAEFFLAENPATAREILDRRGVHWVVAYDAERVARNSTAILGKAASERCLARVLDQRPARAPRFLTLSVQNGTGKIFQVANKW